MNHELTVPDDVLGPDGCLKHRGWARRPLLNYERRKVAASRLRIKEWDYYFVGDGVHGFACTVADNGYLGFVSATWFDFTQPREVSKAVMVPFPMGKFGLPPSSTAGDVVFRHQDLTVEFHREPGRRTLVAESSHFADGQPLRASLVLKAEADDSMTIAIPFSTDRKAFYYDQKINCQPAEGEVAFGSTVHRYDPVSAFGVLDWGRGVWTYDNTWYWGSASGVVDGRRFGFNIGYGFGDTSAASENLLLVDGRAHKLDQVTFHIPEDSFVKPWKFSSSDGRFEMDFLPILDRASNTDLIVLKSDQHQVFGLFTGTAILDDGTRIAVKDFFGFAEKVWNRW